MRLLQSLSFLLLGIHMRATFADLQAAQGPLDALHNVRTGVAIDPLTSLKQLADLASTLSALTESLGGNVGKNDPILSSPDNLDSGTDKRNPAATNSDESPGQSQSDVDAISALAQFQSVLSVASNLFSSIETNPDNGDMSTQGEKRGRGQIERKMTGTGTAPDSASRHEGDGPLDILESVGALRRLVSLVSGAGMLADEGKPVGSGRGKTGVTQMSDSAILSRPKVAREGEGEGERQRVGESKARSPTPPKPQQTQAQPQPVDIFARLEAIQRFSKLAHKISILTKEDENGTPTTLPERMHLIFTDPEVTSTISYIFTNANKVLTPEVLNLLRTFIQSSPLVPDEYRSLAVTIADSLGAVFNPDFARHFASVKETLDKAGVDLLPALGTIWQTVQWAMDTFDPVYIAQLNKQVQLWRRAFASDQMKELVEYITDPEVLGSVTDRIVSVKGALTAERVHKLNILFEKHGFLRVTDEVYQAVGTVIGEKIRMGFTTPEGISELQSLIDGGDLFIDSGMLADVSELLQSRAQSLTPDIAEDITHFIRQLTALPHTLPYLTQPLQDAINLIRPLLEPSKRAERVRAWSFWVEINLIFEKLFSIRSATFVAWNDLLVMTERLLQAHRVQSLRILIEDIMMSEEYTAPSLLDPGKLAASGNVSAVIMAGLEMFGIGEMSPPSGDGLKDICQVLSAVDCYLAPERVDGTREAVRVLSEAISFSLEVFHIFETGPHEGVIAEDISTTTGTHSAHDEL